MARSTSTAIAFVQRDLRIALSYRAPFLFDLVGAFFVIFEFYYLAKLVPASGPTGDYLGFVVTGLIVTTFLVSGASVVTTNIRQEQVQGTLEVTLSAGLSLRSLSVGISAYPVLAGAIRGAIYTIVAAALGARVTGANWGLAAATMAIGAVSFVAIGLMAVGLVLVFRQAAGAAGWLLGAATLLAGVVFPLELLPGWLRFLSGLSAATWTLRATRDAVLGGASWGEGLRSLLILALMALAYVLLSQLVLGWGLRRAVRSGGLSQY
jgi:ABC-2 type transport system permease protein